VTKVARPGRAARPLPTAAGPDAIRRHNLALLLGHVHHDGALTRAELTQRLAVSRSTVGALVAELTDLGLVEELVPVGGDRVGRPSHVVGPHSAGPFVVGVDVDITHLTIAAVGIGGVVLERRTVPTGPLPPSPGEVVDLVTTAVDDLAAGSGRTVLGIGVSVPGTVDKHTRAVGVAPNLGWRDARLGDLFRDRVGSLPVTVGNDADLACLAELSRGHARGCQDVVFLIGRIGVGAGIVVNGVPLRGRDGRAGEVGHTVMDPTGPECHCGKRGCLETFIGDAALLGLAGRDVPPTAENVAAVFADARAGDARAGAAVLRVAGLLGQALGTLANILDPQQVVLGGSLSAVLELARPEIERQLHRHALDPTRLTMLTASALGGDASLLGAAELAFTDLLDDPVSLRVAVP
jgi:predicted NBD/HSP70 family sugar kinase